jgi:GNAT superfamily N-acetyltransferase
MSANEESEENAVATEIAYQLIPYTSEYRAACADMFYNIFTQPPFGFSWLSREKLDRYFVDMENTPQFLGYLYMEKDRMVGACYGQIDDYFMTKAYRINEFFIDESHQEQGLGSDFLRDIENLLQQRGIETIYLFAQKYTKAYAFYRHNNFLANEETTHMVKVMR